MRIEVTDMEKPLRTVSSYIQVERGYMEFLMSQEKETCC